MSRSLKRILFIMGGAAGLLLLVAVAVLLLVDVNRYKPRMETAASNALGMDVRIGGRMRLGVLPGVHLAIEDSRILDEHEVVVASAKRTTLWLALLPLFRGELRLGRVVLKRPVLFIERAPEGDLNVERLAKAATLLGTLEGARLSLSDGTFRYADRRSGDSLAATGLNLDVSRLRFAGGRSPHPWKNPSLEAGFDCTDIRTRTLAVSDLKASVHGKDGVFEFEPITMQVFGGQATGSLRADVSGTVPLYQVHYSLQRFRIEEFFKVLSPKKAGEGAMDFSASLSMQGTTRRQMVQSAAGEISLRGQDLTLVGNDLDRAISRFQASQGFNLVDVGAVFFAGPLGRAVTKGYNFASLFRGSGGTSNIGTLVSDWTVEHGVARARDVAMSTTRNRIALQGGLDFANRRFADVTVAVVDAKGCAMVRQVIRGSFEQPVVEKPHVLASLAGPVVKVYRQTRGLFPQGPCEVFYSGSVVPPN